MKRIVCGLMMCFFIAGLATAHAGGNAKKPSPAEALDILKQGNERFYRGESLHPHIDIKRIKQTGTESQADHAYATIVGCSDSRVPPELIFDAGLMDLFVIRVAGNVCDTDEIGSVEYGVAHVRTPVLVILGHGQCGAVTAVTHAITGKGHALEANIPPLVDNIEPAVKRALKQAHWETHGDAVVPLAIEQNVYQSIEDLFMHSAATRDLVKKGAVMVVGAIYDVNTGRVKWLPEKNVTDILTRVEKNKTRAMNPMAEPAGDVHH